MKNTIWRLDRHTRAKHAILRKYLDAWLPKITRFNGRVIYYDGFAGPGKYAGGEEGSPLIALRAFLEHSHKHRIDCEIKYYLVESDSDRFKCLDETIAELRPGLPSSVEVIVLPAESDAVLTTILGYLEEQGRAIAPTFAFIDPFGVKGIPLNTVKRLMQHRSCEVMINVMLGPMHRFVATPEFEQHCDGLFGCIEWRQGRELEGSAREQFLRDLYQRQMQDPNQGVGARYVRHFTMKDKKDRTIYDLFFATNHPKGIDAMKDAMWKVDGTGEYQFSDATNPNQATLFSADPDWSSLIAALHKQFAGKYVPWPNLEEAIRRSPFRILKQEIRRAMNAEHSPATIENPEGVRRDALNDHTFIRFAPQ